MFEVSICCVVVFGNPRGKFTSNNLNSLDLLLQEVTRVLAMAESSTLFAALPVVPGTPPSSSRSQCSTQCHGVIPGTKRYEITAVSCRKSMKFSKQLVDFTGQSRLQALSGTSLTLSFYQGFQDTSRRY